MQAFVVTLIQRFDVSLADNHPQIRRARHNVSTPVIFGEEHKIPRLPLRITAIGNEQSMLSTLLDVLEISLTYCCISCGVEAHFLAAIYSLLLGFSVWLFLEGFEHEARGLAGDAALSQGQMATS